MSPRARSPKIVKRSLALLPPKDSLPAAALLSFLKETRGRTVWAEHDLIKSLNITSAAARQALAILEMQGYVNQANKHEWLTTQQGEVVSGSKFPKYSRKSVEQSLDSFSDHLKRVNQDSSAEYKITGAVAFGDFLSERARVQAADVGIRLEPRNPEAHKMHSASEQERQEAFLKQLRGKTPLLNLHPYADWMSTRAHRNLIASR